MYVFGADSTIMEDDSTLLQATTASMYNSCSLISAIKKGENDRLLLKSFGIIALVPFFLCRDVMLLGDVEEVTFWRLIWLFCWSKAKF